MGGRDYKDICGGGVLIAIGGSAAIYAGTHYTIGTARQIGPGMFPVVLGIILVVFGLLIAIPALKRPGRMPAFAFIPFLSVVVSVLAFAFTIEPLGLIPAIVILTITATLADRRLTFLGTAVLAVLLSVSCAVIFRYGLGISLQLARWPF